VYVWCKKKGKKKKEKKSERKGKKGKKRKKREGEKGEKKYCTIPNFYTAYYQVEFVPGFTLCDMQLPA